MAPPIARLALVSSIVLLAFYTLIPRRDTHDPSSPGFPVFHRHIVAIGDLHGDLPNALEVLEMAGVIDSRRKWTGNVDFLVQTGDIIDRGDDTIALYRLMENLREQARAVGGDVLSHLGNHEYMNAIGDWRYVYESEIKTFGSVAARQEMISNGWIGHAWRTNYTVTSRLPLHPSLGLPNTDYIPNSSPLSHAALSFLHGGISPTYLNAVPYPSRINTLGASLLRKLQKREQQPPPHPPNPYPGLPGDATDEEHDLYGTNGPLWYRGWALDDDHVVCREVDAVLEKTGTRRLIMGHTPTFDRMISRCDGKIILIDTGISSAYGGVLSALDIKYSLIPIDDSVKSALGTRAAASAKREKYLEQEIIQAIYPGKRDIFVSHEREIAGHAF